MGGTTLLPSARSTSFCFPGARLSPHLLKLEIAGRFTLETVPGPRRVGGRIKIDEDNAFTGIGVRVHRIGLQFGGDLGVGLLSDVGAMVGELERLSRPGHEKTSRQL